MRRLDDDSPAEEVEIADPREVLGYQQGTPTRDAAVDPEDGDFLAPEGAGQGNPHGPDVVAPGIHAEQGLRPVKPKAVREASQQEGDERSHYRRTPRS